MMNTKSTAPLIKTIGLIGLCFLLTSTGWLSWEYHLMNVLPSRITDVMTMVFGYLLQAAGIGLYAFLIWKRPRYSPMFLQAALIGHLLLMIPAVLSTSLAGILVFGLLMNIACGMIAGAYLYSLSKQVPKQQMAVAFGSGYAAAICGSFLLSRINKGTLYYSGWVILIVVILTVAAVFLALKMPKADEALEEGSIHTPMAQKDRSFLLLLFFLVIFFGLVNNCGFAFPTADIGRSVNVELSRLVYAAGLIIAGLVTDKERKYGAVLALMALIIPFLLLALKGEIVSSLIFWILSYFTFGFYSVYRIILFSDKAKETGFYLLSGFGLLAGRLGDAAGEAICIALENRLLVLIIVAVLLFAASVVLFFKVYPRLYLPEATAQMNEQEKFYRFAVQHDLSNRERDLLELILQNKTVAEIADTLSISENTVKYHVKNILQKTGCRSRKDLIAAYIGRISS